MDSRKTARAGRARQAKAKEVPMAKASYIPEPVMGELLREQLDYLIDHTEVHPQCGCGECKRFLRVQAVLVEIFLPNPKRKK